MRDSNNSASWIESAGPFGIEDFFDADGKGGVAHPEGIALGEAEDVLKGSF